MADAKQFLAELEREHRSHSARPLESQLQRRVRASYDAAQTTDENTKHWANADTLSARAAHSSEIRKTLRSRSRYECHENNCYGKRLVRQISIDTIGTGPRLQVLTNNPTANQRIEREFERWARDVMLADKLRTMRTSKAVDGEAFALMTTNPRARNPVKLWPKLYEADQVATPVADVLDPRFEDGIQLDDFGNPVAYHLLRTHPGDNLLSYFPYDFERIPADQMVHIFDCTRPGQVRGVPETTPALPLFAMLRRFTLATVAAAETAASLAGVMFTDASSLTADEIEEGEAFDAIDWEMRAMLTLPRGWKMGQLKSEHPATTHAMFVESLLREIGAAMNVPFNKIAGDSSKFNFASGKLDNHDYYNLLDTERAFWEIAVLDKLFEAWWMEAILIEGLLPLRVRMLSELPHRWFWDENRPDIDPAKGANARKTELETGMTTFPTEYARRGLDWEVEQQKQAEALGLTVEEYRELLVKKLFGSGTAAPEDTETEDESKADDSDDSNESETDESEDGEGNERQEAEAATA